MVVCAFWRKDPACLDAEWAKPFAGNAAVAVAEYSFAASGEPDAGYFSLSLRVHPASKIIVVRICEYLSNALI